MSKDSRFAVYLTIFPQNVNLISEMLKTSDSKTVREIGISNQVCYRGSSDDTVEINFQAASGKYGK